MRYYSTQRPASLGTFPGCPGTEFEVDVSGDGILNQTVVSYTIDGGICHAITE